MTIITFCEQNGNFEVSILVWNMWMTKKLNERFCFQAEAPEVIDLISWVMHSDCSIAFCLGFNIASDIWGYISMVSECSRGTLTNHDATTQVCHDADTRYDTAPIIAYILSLSTLPIVISWAFTTLKSLTRLFKHKTNALLQCYNSVIQWKDQ